MWNFLKLSCVIANYKFHFLISFFLQADLVLVTQTVDS